MESQIKSSFIPQDVGKVPMRPRKFSGAGSADLIVLAAVVILIASIALGGAVFLYSQYLNTSIASKQQSIDRARAAIEPGLIEELSRLDARMRSSGLLLGRHIAPSILFEVLEQVTLQSVVLTKLGVTTSGPDSTKITLEGLARSVNSVALQSDLYGKSGLITSPIFSDISRQPNGLVHFKVDALINANNFHYARLVEGQGGQQNTVQEQPLIQSSGASTSTEGSVPSFTPTQ